MRWFKQWLCKHNGTKRIGLEIICTQCNKILFTFDKIEFIEKMRKFGFTDEEIKEDLESKI